MHIQTITATTVNTNSFGVDFEITTFEMTTTGFCDICGNQENGTEDSLRNQGWHLGSREHFCPNCNS